MAGRIVYDENGNLVLNESTGGGVYVEHNEQGTTAQFGVWDKGNLTGGIMVQEINGQSTTTINGYKINIGTLADAINGSTVTINAERINLNGYVTTSMMESAFQDIQQATISQLTVSGSLFTFDGHDVDWKDQYILYSLDYDSYHNYETTDAGNHRARYATGANGKTIYYLGR